MSNSKSIESDLRPFYSNIAHHFPESLSITFSFDTGVQLLEIAKYLT